MQAYYNVLSNIKAKLEADAFVNTVTQGDIFDIDLNKQTIFPLSHIIINDVRKSKNILVFNVTVMCMDIVDISKDETTDNFRGNDNEQDVLNTQMAVGLRLVELLERGSNNSQFMMRGEPTFEGFTERFENNIAGWAVTFDIHVPNTMTSCDDVATGVVCNPANVSNSDASYTASVASGGTLSLPDIDINVNGVDEGDIPSVADVSVNLTNSFGTVTPEAVNVTGSTVAITLPDSAPSPVGATLVKTGQTISYRTGDDGDLEKGRAVDFSTLNVNNPFGNTNRFTDELGGQTYTNDIVIDWSTYDTVAGTVLGYYRVISATQNWDDAVDNALLTSVGSYTSGWYLPNIYQLENISQLTSAITRSTNYAPFNISYTGFLWSSTTKPNNTSSAMVLYPFQFQTSDSPKTTSSGRLYIPVREFTVTGTTLT
jgi:hypothetical protein